MAGEQPKKVAGGAFGQYLSANRPQLMKECAGQPITAVTKLASTKFKALGDAERKVYQDKYEEAKSKYETDMAAFLAAGGEKKGIKRKGDADDKKQAKKLKKLTKDPDAPKRPAGGAFGSYLEKNRPQLAKECAGKPITAVTKLAAEQFKSLSEVEKKEYEDMYQAKKKAYEEAMKTYVPPPVPEGVELPKTKKETREEAKAAKAQEKSDAKAAKTAAKNLTTPTKKTRQGKPVTPPPVELMPNIIAKADKLGFKDTLLKLAARDDVKESGKSQAEMLKALEEHSGLLHPSRRSLLGC
jgi:hypothetical protein